MSSVCHFWKLHKQYHSAICGMALPSGIERACPLLQEPNETSTISRSEQC
jgi:hypothetical protein